MLDILKGFTRFLLVLFWIPLKIVLFPVFLVITFLVDLSDWANNRSNYWKETRSLFSMSYWTRV